MGLTKFQKKIAVNVAANDIAQTRAHRNGVPKTPKGLAKFEKKIAASKGEVGEYAKFNEIQRIIGMPIISPMTDEEFEEYNYQHVLAKAMNDGFRLFPIQADAHKAFETYGGLFGPIGVGWGKTLLTLMIANTMFQRGLERVMLMIPPEVLSQLVEQQLPVARTLVPITYPVHILGGRSKDVRRRLCRRATPGLYVFPYSLLSMPDAVDNLIALQPHGMVGDEAHRISNRTAARTRRVVSFLDQVEPDCAFVSGTITSKSIRDYHHLIRAALKDNNPLPNTASLAFHWAAVLDAEAGDWRREREPVGGGPLLPLVDWARDNFPEEEIEETQTGFRTAYRKRLITAPGVVSSGESDIGTTLRFANKPIKNYKLSENWKELESLMRKVTDQWLTPNDDEIEHAIHTWKWLYELSAGFYNELVWPEPEVYAKRRNISVDEAADILFRAQEHHALGQEYAKLLRKWIQNSSRPGLDTPLVIGQEMARNGAKNVGSELYEAWHAWKEADFDGRPDRDSHAIRVCPFKVDAAAEWAIEANKNGGCIIWYYHQEIGRWLYDILCKWDRSKVLLCAAGEQHNKAILDPKNSDRIIIASITAHGTGKNLQHFQQQCIVQWPRQAKMAEQMLGRLHRNGQKADEIEAVTFNTIEFDQLNFAACLNDALYIHQTTDVRQKMIYGEYNPLPRIIPPEVLRQRGAEGVRMLDDKMKKALKERFEKQT